MRNFASNHYLRYGFLAALILVAGSLPTLPEHLHRLRDRNPDERKTLTVVQNDIGLAVTCLFGDEDTCSTYWAFHPGIPQTLSEVASDLVTLPGTLVWDCIDIVFLRKDYLTWAATARQIYLGSHPPPLSSPLVSATHRFEAPNGTLFRGEKVTLLMVAAMGNNLAAIETILRKDPDSLHRKTSSGWTALTYAVWCSQKNAVSALLVRGADPLAASDLTQSKDGFPIDPEISALLREAGKTSHNNK